jgi:hypothetical protein
MRFLQSGAVSGYNFTKNFVGDDSIPPYAILSHTWGPENEEVTFEDIANGTAENNPGYAKVRYCGSQARGDGLAYFWIDTCCIQKSNSVELQEAINSMFRWYRNADKCYVYLVDVATAGQDPDARLWVPAFQKSRWFTRGWTLQELIAPKDVEFFAKDWTFLGNKSTLEAIISGATGVSSDVLRGRPLIHCTIEERLMWAKGRATRREEDCVYSLLGIFDVTMPLIYGEGKVKAFRRFHEEIVKYGKCVALPYMRL